MPRVDTGAAHLPVPMPGASRYTILVPGQTLSRAEDLLAELRLNRSRAGGSLQSVLAEVPMESLAPLDLLALLFDTRRPQIFAESEVAGDGSDWSLAELSLLGDVSVAVPVTIFDDGAHRHPAVHATPFRGMLVFTAGALLANGHGHTPADWPEVVSRDGRVDPDGLLNLYRRRLVPVLRRCGSCCTTTARSGPTSGPFTLIPTARAATAASRSTASCFRCGHPGPLAISRSPSSARRPLTQQRKTTSTSVRAAPMTASRQRPPTPWR